MKNSQLRISIFPGSVHTLSEKFENSVLLLHSDGPPIDPSRKRVSSKTLFKSEEFEIAGLAFLVWTGYILKLKLFEND